jgi:hypothetical protein
MRKEDLVSKFLTFSLSWILVPIFQFPTSTVLNFRDSSKFRPLICWKWNINVKVGLWDWRSWVPLNSVRFNVTIQKARFITSWSHKGVAFPFHYIDPLKWCSDINQQYEQGFERSKHIKSFENLSRMTKEMNGLTPDFSRVFTNRLFWRSFKENFWIM